MTLNIALNTVKSAGWNSLYAGGHLAAGFAVGFAINKIAHTILGAKPDSKISKAIVTIAALAGIATSVYFAPQAALVSIAAKQALTVVALCAVAMTVVHSLDYEILHLICTGSIIIGAGAATGALSVYLLPVFGTFGAIMGAGHDVLDGPCKSCGAAR